MSAADGLIASVRLLIGGVGLAFLMRSWARQSLNLGRLYRNRMIGLRILCIARECFSPLRSSIRSPR